MQDGGTPPRSATGTAHITVLDENDHAPAFTHARPDRELLFQVRMNPASNMFCYLYCMITKIKLLLIFEGVFYDA